MSYTKTNWTDGTTPLDASNMNKIEDALSDQDSRIDANTDLINSLDIVSSRGTNIPSNSDLNDYLTPGKYYSNGGSVSATLENCPTRAQGSGFALYVFNQASSTTYRFQLLIRTGNAVNPMMFYREYVSDWGSWFQITASTES